MKRIEKAKEPSAAEGEENPMNNKHSSHPLICIDFKKNRIRIHHNTLRQISNPNIFNFLLILIKKMIGIKNG